MMVNNLASNPSPKRVQQTLENISLGAIVSVDLSIPHYPPSRPQNQGGRLSRLKIGSFGLLLAILGVSRPIWATCDATLLPTYTPRAGIPQPAINSCGWGAVTNANWAIMDSSACYLSATNNFTGQNNFSLTPLNLKGANGISFYNASNTTSAPIQNFGISGKNTLDITSKDGLTINQNGQSAPSPQIGGPALIVFPGTSQSYGSFAVYGSSADSSLAYSGFIGTSSINTSTLWSLPTKDGINGQAMTTDGAAHLSFTTIVGGGGGGSSTLQVTQTGVQITSPTASLRFYGGDFTLQAPSVSTTSIILNPNTTDFIQNNPTSIQVATFSVTSGTVNGQLTTNNSNPTGVFLDPPSILLERQDSTNNCISWSAPAIINRPWQQCANGNDLSLGYGSVTGGMTQFISLDTNGSFPTGSSVTINTNLVFGTANQFLKVNGNGSVKSYDLLNATQTWTGQNNWIGPLPSSFTYNVTAGSMTVNGSGNGVITETIGVGNAAPATYTVLSSTNIGAGNVTVSHVAVFTSTNGTLGDGGAGGGGGGPTLAANQTWTGVNNWSNFQASTFSIVNVSSLTVKTIGGIGGEVDFWNSGGNNPQIKFFTDSGASMGSINFLTGTYFRIEAADASALVLRTNSTDRLRIENGGNVGVNEAGPADTQFGILGATGNKYTFNTSTSSFYQVAISSSGHYVTGGSTPTISGCGTTPNGSVVGNDKDGVITIGGGSVTGCTLTFSQTYGLGCVVACTISDSITTTTPDVTSTPTTMTLGFSASIGGGTVEYHCVGVTASCL
jgi:hypothetical protein